MKSFAGKNVWIIGASSGIGRALAIELSRQGATLALSARSEDKLKALNEKLGGKHHVVAFDASEVDRFVEKAQDVKNTLKHIDSVVFLPALYDPMPMSELDIQKVHTMVNVNLNGTFNAVYAVLPILKEQGSGQFALCGSVAGYRGLPKGQPYSATKAGVMNLVESLRAEEKDLDIKLISPGFVRTSLTDKNNFKMPMMIEPEEAAQAIAKGLLKKAFEIHFPKRFTLLMKIIRLLPAWVYFKLVVR